MQPNPFRRAAVEGFAAVAETAAAWAIRIGGERQCPTCTDRPCYTHCFECGADVSDGGPHIADLRDGVRFCETGDGIFTVTARDVLRGGMRCCDCSVLLRYGDRYTHVTEPLHPEPGKSCTSRSVCLRCAALAEWVL